MLVIHTFIFEHSGVEDSWGPPWEPHGGPRDEWEQTQPTRNLPTSRGDGITSLFLRELIFWEQAPITDRRLSQMSRPNSAQAHEVTRCARAVMQSWFSAGRACAFSHHTAHRQPGDAVGWERQESIVVFRNRNYFSLPSLLGEEVVPPLLPGRSIPGSLPPRSKTNI